MEDVESSLRALLEPHGQEHLLRHWDALSTSEREQLRQDLTAIDFARVMKFFERCTEEMHRGDKLDEFMEPLPTEIVGSYAASSPDQLKDYEQEGLRQISEDKVAVLLLAGGQGTRLGVSYPKGMYNVGLPSGRTLYQFQAERIIKVQQMAKELTGKSGIVTWYVMTSEYTQETTEKFFVQHNHFGLNPSDIVFFEQNTLPCVSFDGKIILETSSKISRAPDGNGGLYRAIEDHKILDDMKRRGVTYIHVYCVDNILVKMADPVFMGFCIQRGAACGTKVAEKTDPTEPVGVVCRVRGRYQVVEYSEISVEASERKDGATGKLVFNAGTIANHFFTRDFLSLIVSEKEPLLQHHVAKKKVPFCDEQGKLVKPTAPNGIKMEKFVFDVFPFADEFVVWEVTREDEFSPLKNADGAPVDTPTTSRSSLLDLHGRWMLAAGGSFVRGEEQSGDSTSLEAKDDAPIAQCEISPLLSYAGEGLESIARGNTFTPLSILDRPKSTE